MVFDISVKIKELGDVQGSFLKATKDSIYIKNALMSRASTTKISLLKIDRRYIVSVDRISAPAFDSFTDSELAAALRTAPRYADAIKEVQAAKQADADKGSQGSRAAADKRAPKRGKKGEWDQFEANSKLFGVAPVFDMSEYAAPIDTNSSTYRRDLEKSARIASEIMSQKTDDAHRLGERGAAKSGEASDEHDYSTVRDSGKWDRKAPQASMEDAGRRSEGGENIITIPAKNAKDSTMEELNKRKEEVISETNNENPDSQKMWASLKQFLSLKKQVEDSTNGVPSAEPAGAEKTPIQASPQEGKTSSEQGRPRQPSADKAEHKPGSGHGGPHKDGRGDRDAGRSFKPGAKDGASKPSYKNPRRQDDSSDQRASKQVIIGSALRYKSADEFIGLIISKFAPPGAGTVKESWGAGCMIEDKIEYIKKKQMCILPSEQRLSDILSFAPYRNKK